MPGPGTCREELPILVVERVDPFAVVPSMDDATPGRIVAMSRRLLLLTA